MALATLQWQDATVSHHHFRVDIGSNRFYRIAIGTDRDRSASGLPQLRSPRRCSPLLGPLPESSLGRTTLKIPRHYVDSQYRFIQLQSFRTPRRDGPALSEILAIAPDLAPDLDPDLVDLPATAFALESVMNQETVDAVAFSYEEEDLSSSLFLGKIIKGVTSIGSKVLPKVLPGVGKLLKTGDVIGTVGDIAGGLLSGKGMKKSLKATIPKLLNNPQTTQLLQTTIDQMVDTTTLTKLGVNSAQFASLIQQIATRALAGGTVKALSLEEEATAIAVNGNGTYPRNGTAHRLSYGSGLQGSKLGNLVERLPATALAFDGEEARQLSSSGPKFERRSLRPHPELSDQASVATAMSPTALAFTAIPTLMPLLRGAIAPQTLRTLMYNPSPRITLSTLEAGLEEVARIAPYWEDSEAYRRPAPIHPFHRLEAVQLDFMEAAPLILHGREQLVYSQNHTLSFPLQVSTPKPIRRAKLFLTVKDAETRQLVLKQGYPALRNITAGPLNLVPTLSPSQLADLPANREYLVSAILLWPGRSKDTGRPIRVGTSLNQLITLMDEYCFDRIEGDSETVNLNEVDRFRPYWHKVWQGNLSGEQRRLTLDCKYYYALEDDRPHHARMETLFQIEPPDGSRQTGNLKTGMVLSPFRLNALMAEISDNPPLDSEQLAALVTAEFRSRFSHVAQTQVKFKGRPGEGMALWVYPELKLQRIMLKRVAQTDANGQVTALAEHAIYFPLPTAAHFVGTSNAAPD